MIEIIPAILPKDYEDLKNKTSLVRGVVPVVQIDICDGTFVPSTTWPFTRSDFGNPERPDLCELDLHFQNILNDREGLPFWEDVDFELDLMVLDAVENLDVYTKLGPRRIIFHLEAVGDLEEFKNFLEGIDPFIKDVTEFGIAINTNTDVEKIFPLIQHVRFVQVMGIEKIGLQGEDFDHRCLEQVKKIKTKFPGIIISVDGGVTLQNAKQIFDTGAERLVVGSAIFKTDDIIGTIEKFQEL